MAQLLFTVKQSAADVIGSISVATRGINATLTTATNYVEALEHVSKGYKENVIADEAQRTERRMHQNAVNDATFYIGLEDSLKGDPRLTELYKRSLTKYGLTA